MAKRVINTFVFFDVEGTGLTDNPRITEITMLAMHRSAGEEMIFRARKSLWAPGAPEGPPEMPRVINKLTICIYPMKPICPEAAEITGLCNDLLYQQKDFDPEVGELLNHFLRRLEPPVCLVAHNGHRFDFPLLCAELQSTGSSSLTLSNGEPVLCIDTWEMFRDLDGDPVNYPNRYLREESSSPPPIVITPDSHPSDECEVLTTSDGDREKDNKNCSKKRVMESAENSGGCESVNGVTDTSPAPDQTTPTECKTIDVSSFGMADRKKKRIESEGDSSGGDSGSSKLSHARRQLFPESNTDDGSAKDVGNGIDTGNVSDSSLVEHVQDLKTESCDVDAGSQRTNTPKANVPSCKLVPVRPTPPPVESSNTFAAGPLRPIVGTGRFARRANAVMTMAKRPSYKLVDLHQRIIGQDPTDSHRAEDDCVTLARIFWLTPKAPLWADVHAVPFDRFRPLYVTRRRPLPPGKFPCSS